MSDLVDQVRARFELLRPVMDERMIRLWAAAEAQSLGHGGGAVVTAATGIRRKRIGPGKLARRGLEASPPVEKPRDQRVRRPGAGRKPLVEKDPTLTADLER